MTDQLTQDEYEKHREAIRAKGHVVNPYRLGLSVGRSGDELPAPYTNHRSVKQYKDGFEYGHKWKVGGV